MCATRKYFLHFFLFILLQQEVFSLYPLSHLPLSKENVALSFMLISVTMNHFAFLFALIKKTGVNSLLYF